MKSFLLPSPLLDSKSWYKPSDGDVWLLPLDVATACGGALKQRFKKIIETKNALWFLPSEFLRSASNLSFGLRVIALREWISVSSRSELFSDDPSYIANKLGLANVRRAAVAAPSLFDWAKEIFPNLTLKIGELRLRESLNTYEKEVPDAAGFPWEGLRFFAGFLRQKKIEGADAAAMDWLRFSALYSPQDEEAEKRSLAEEALILNPTMQFHRGGTELIVIGRRLETLVERAIDWREALILDEVMEAPRTLASSVIQKCGSEHPTGRDFAPVLDGLIADGILLRGSP